MPLLLVLDSCVPSDWAILRLVLPNMLPVVLLYCILGLRVMVEAALLVLRVGMPGVVRVVWLLVEFERDTSQSAFSCFQSSWF